VLQGKGEGFIKLALEYRSLETIGAQDMSGAHKGLLVATIIRAFNLAAPGAAAPKSAVTLKVSRQGAGGRSRVQACTVQHMGCRWA
jgi:hypothetical protein